MPLPIPTGRQREVLVLPAQGHVAVLGTAGSGKTTLAILRSAYLSDPETDHSGRTLLVTFNRALVAYLRHLQEKALANVVVENYHRFARGYLASLGLMGDRAICEGEERLALIRRAVRDVAARYKSNSFFERQATFFSDEISWITQHGFKNPGVYESAERVGRAAARIERRLRSIMFEIYARYRDLLQASRKVYDWDNLATAVCESLDADKKPRRYRHVVIDEGQDFSPEMIRSLSKGIPADGSLTFFGDMAQQIYGQRISWRSAGLRISKVWEFKDNYRNSKQIASLGLAISRMPYFQETPDMVEPVAPTADGPLPTIVKCRSPETEINLVVEQSVEASRTLTVAVLFRDRDDEQLISRRLRGSIRLHRDMSQWRAGPGIRYGTYHSAKGLEFDMVLLPFLRADRLPDPDTMKAFGGEEAATRDGKLLYVAVTRAKTRLIMTYTGAITGLLPGEPSLYQQVNR